MKFESVNTIANNAKRYFPEVIPHWTVEDASRQIAFIAKASRTKKQAAKILYETIEEYTGEQLSNRGISLERFISEVI